MARIDTKLRLSASLPVPVLLPILFLKPRSRSSYQILFYIILIVASTVGALASLLGLAAVEGTVREVQQRITGIGSYIDINSKNQNAVPGMCDQEKTIGLIRAVPHVTSVAPYVISDSVIETADDSREVIVRAIEPESEARTSRIAAYVVPHDAMARLGTRRTSATPVLAGMSLAKTLRLKVGDKVVLTHSGGNILGRPPTLLDGIVVGVFHTGLATDNWIIVPIEDMLALADMPSGCATGYSVLTDDMASSGTIARNLAVHLGANFHVTNWTERFPLYNQTILLLSRLTGLLTSVIVVITMTAVTAVAMLVSYTKRRDFATLFALGLSITQIRLAHICLALIIGFVGFVFASASAPLICNLCNAYQYIKVPGSLDNTFVSFSLLGRHFLLVAFVEICCLLPLGWVLPHSLGTRSLTRILRDE